MGAHTSKFHYWFLFSVFSLRHPCTNLTMPCGGLSEIVKCTHHCHYLKFPLSFFEGIHREVRTQHANGPTRNCVVRNFMFTAKRALKSVSMTVIICLPSCPFTLPLLMWWYKTGCLSADIALRLLALNRCNHLSANPTRSRTITKMSTQTLERSKIRQSEAVHG